MFGVVLTVTLLCVWLLHGASGAETEVSVMEGDSVTLHTGVKTNQQDRIRWYYNNLRIALITGDYSETCTDDWCEERFRDRLQLDPQTGSLTITDTRTTDSGLYQLQLISSSSFSVRRTRSFSVSVTGSGWSSAAAAGVCAAVVTLLVAAASAVIYYRKQRGSRTATLNNETDPVKYSSANGPSQEKTETPP